MAITKHIVDAMKGAIELKSEVNKGTEFHIILDMERNTEKEEDMLLLVYICFQKYTARSNYNAYSTRGGKKMHYKNQNVVISQM